jgi:hypothetical protein
MPALVSSLDNYMLWSASVGDYTLFSPVQKETGPRLFYPFFGLAYMGKNSQIRILVLKNGVYQVKLQILRSRITAL